MIYVVYDRQEGNYLPHWFSGDRSDVIKCFAAHLKSVVKSRANEDDDKVLNVLGYVVKGVTEIQHKELLNEFYSVDDNEGDEQK